MKKCMKALRKFIVLIFITFILITSFNNTKADSSNIYLNDLEFNIQINSDGSIDVEEMWNIDIKNTNTLFKTFEKDLSKYTSITQGNVSKINSDGTQLNLKDVKQYYYHVPTNSYYFLNRGNEYEVAWGTGYENTYGKERYKISYHVEDVIAIYEDCSEMYWQLLGSNFEIPAKKITGTIKLPKQVENIEDMKVWGHTPDLNGTIYKEDKDKIEFTVNDNKAKKMVEVRIVMPKDIVQSSKRTYNINKLESIIEEETTWAKKANSIRLNKIIIISIICLVIFGVLIYFLVKSIILIKNTKEVIPTKHYEYFRELPREECTPAEALYILKNKYYDFDSYEIGEVFSSTILNLSLKKALKIERIIDEKGKEEVRIEILCNNISNITNKKDEILIFDFIKTACKNKVITMKELKKYIQRYQSRVISLKASIDKYIKTELIANKMLDVEGIKKRNKLMLGGCMSVFATFFIFFFVTNINIITSSLDNIGISWVVLIAMGILLVVDIVLENKAKKKISVYTQKGIDEQDKWIALKRYMQDFSLLKEKEVPDLVLWEKFLVYATAFGISEKVIKQLKIVYPEYNNLDYSVYPNMYIFMHMDFNKSFNSVSNSMSSTFSSASGGGGGFSGGGGRWRRPVVGGGGR